MIDKYIETESSKPVLPVKGAQAFDPDEFRVIDLKARKCFSFIWLFFIFAKIENSSITLIHQFKATDSYQMQETVKCFLDFKVLFGNVNLKS
jgi:hypothetical protein